MKHHFNIQRRFRILLAAMAAVLLLSGCGVDETLSAVQDFRDRLTGENTGEKKDAGKDDDSDAESMKGFVEIPDGTVFISDEYDYSEVKEKLAEAFENMETSVCIQGKTWFDTPDFYAMPYSTFWLEDFSATRFWGRRKEDEEKSFFDFYKFDYYDLSADQVRQMKEEIDAATAEITEKVSAKARSWGKSKTVHDELCRLITYDKTQSLPHCHDLYGALVSHQAVCSGYACAFTHIMGEMGITCPLSYSDSHAWNRVNAPTYEEYIDITWDDTDMTDKFGNPYIDYSYFFLTREECESIDSHSIQSFDPITELSPGKPYNYYSHEGYLAEDLNEETITEIFRKQYKKGGNLLTVRFAHEEDYKKAKTWQDNNGEGFNTYLSALQYYEPYYFWYNDTVHTISIGLYADV